MTSSITAINYYGMDKVDAPKINASFKSVIDELAAMKIAADSAPKDFVKQVFDSDSVSEMLISLSRLPVFDKEFANTLSHDLDLLAIAKKLKFFTNLPLGQNLLLIQQVLQRYDVRNEGFDSALINLVKSGHGKLSSTRFKDFVKNDGKTLLKHAAKFEENNVALEEIDPHAVYPTSIYRHCDGLTLATSDSQTIEAVMSTTLTTTIKITRGVLDVENRILADVYQPLGRCVALIDDKVVAIYGKKLEAYFAHFGIELVQLIHGGDEIDKDIQNVEQILVELKNN